MIKDEDEKKKPFLPLKSLPQDRANLGVCPAFIWMGGEQRKSLCKTWYHISGEAHRAGFGRTGQNMQFSLVEEYLKRKLGKNQRKTLRMEGVDVIATR